MLIMISLHTLIIISLHLRHTTLQVPGSTYVSDDMLHMFTYADHY